jgi:hypothetical protein
MKSKLNPIGDEDSTCEWCCFWDFDDVACHTWDITKGEYNYICIGKKRCR